MAQELTRGAKINEQRVKLRQQYWPQIPESFLWNRKQRTGFVTMPRTMPLMLSMMDDMSKHKPLSGAYFALWCRTYDDCMVSIPNPMQVAFEAGFGGQRGVQTWGGRMKKLEDLGFIKSKEGAAGPYSHVLLLNPYLVIKAIAAQGKVHIAEAKINALFNRATEIGADDLDETPAAVDTANKNTQSGLVELA
jgi:hypothetical protein